jgi:hypothetical protein
MSTRSCFFVVSDEKKPALVLDDGFQARNNYPQQKLICFNGFVCYFSNICFCCYSFCPILSLFYVPKVIYTTREML